MVSAPKLVAILYFLGLSIISHFISRRSVVESSWKGLRRSSTSWPRLCVLIIFLDSWAFLFASGFLTLAVGLEENTVVCSSAIYLCICFYTTSKFFIYSFLIEKVHIVWSIPGTPRFRSKIFIACFVALMAYLMIITLTFFGRIHFIQDNLCIIGLRHWSALPLLLYDLFMNLVLTGLFLYPLMKGAIKLNQKLRRVAYRTFIAAAFALTTSTVNIAVLAALRGQEPGWVCLASCALDVLINAFAVYWATGLNDQGARSRFTVTSFPEDEIPAEPQWSPGSQKQTFAMDALQSDVSPSKSGVRKMYHGHTISFVISNHGAHAISSQAKSVSMHDGADSEADANSIEMSLTCENEILDAAFSDGRGESSNGDVGDVASSSRT